MKDVQQESAQNLILKLSKSPSPEKSAELTPQHLIKRLSSRKNFSTIQNKTQEDSHAPNSLPSPRKLIERMRSCPSSDFTTPFKPSKGHRRKTRSSPYLSSLCCNHLLSKKGISFFEQVARKEESFLPDLSSPTLLVVVGLVVFFASIFSASSM